MFIHSKKTVQSFSTNWVFFLLFIGVLWVDRTSALIHFGFKYTDIDQLILWNGAMDYSNGIFHEPFFYGQAYNFMLEALIAVPFIFFGVPVYMALPIATSFMALLPFMILGILFFSQKKHLWAYLSLAIPIFLPVGFSFLSMISRGFVQALFFIPLLFIPMLQPEKKRHIWLLFFASSLSFFANQSAVLIIIPVLVYVGSFHYQSLSFWLQSLWVLPAVLIDFLSKRFYHIHPEKVVHAISGLELDAETFFETLGNNRLFEYLLPFTSNGLWVYLLFFLVLVVVAWKKGLNKALLFISAALVMLLVSFAIPKVQMEYPIENAGIFFSVSRFYLTLPILGLICSYLVFQKLPFKTVSIFLLLSLCLVSAVVKRQTVKHTSVETIAKTSFPVAINQELISRSEELIALSTSLNVDLMVHKMYPGWNWDNIYDSYALSPLQLHRPDWKNQEVISVTLSGDRRSWLYEKAESCERILLVGFVINERLLEPFDHQVLDEGYILITKNKDLRTQTLFEKLKFEFGSQGKNP